MISLALYAAAMIQCGPGNASSFRVAPDSLVTVAHALRATNSGCTLNGWRLPKPAIVDASADFALYRGVKWPKASLPVACEPLVPGAQYVAQAYRDGSPVRIKATATGQRYGGREVMRASPRFLPGTSGAPILNTSGAVVAFVLGYDPNGKASFARSVLDTPLCHSTKIPQEAPFQP
jgi:hypothetical protein